MKKLELTVLFIFLLVLRGGVPNASGAGATICKNVALMSDLHFDPYADESLVPELVKSDVKDWKNILEKSSQQTPPAYGRDSNYALLKSAIAAVKKQNSDPCMIVISGDFLAHHFDDEFKKIKPDCFAGGPHTMCKEYGEFVSKTMQFIALLFQDKDAFPNTKIVPVLGNNDSPCGDYYGAPGSAGDLQKQFLADVAEAWRPSVNKGNAAGNDDLANFSDYGHYTTLFQPPHSPTKVRVIALNDIYASHWWQTETDKDFNHCVPAQEAAPAQTLAWLKTQLEAVRQAAATARRRGKPAPERVWIVEHIPSGVDVASVVFNKQMDLCDPSKTSLMLNEGYNAEYLKLLDEYKGVIQLTIKGHTHWNEFRLENTRFPTITVPAVTINHGNNPQFEVLELGTGRHGLGLRDLVPYYLDLGKDPRASDWNQETSFTRSYGVPDLSSRSFQSVVRKLRGADPKYREKYFTLLNGQAAVPPPVRDNWRAYFCGIDAHDAASFKGCACTESDTTPANPE